MVLDFQKCDPAVSQTDPECSTAPIDYQMKIMIDIKALDSQDFIVARDDSLYFDINVVSPCPSDAVTFNTPIESFVHFLKPSGESSFRDPSVVQKHPQCLRKCTLTEDGKSTTPPMFNFNSYTGEINVTTGAKSLHSSVINMALSCTSTFNGYQEINLFSVNF